MSGIGSALVVTTSGTHKIEDPQLSGFLDDGQQDAGRSGVGLQVEDYVVVVPLVPEGIGHSP